MPAAKAFEKKQSPVREAGVGVVRGITQQHTPSPAGDTSHGFAAPRPLAGGPCHLVFPREDKSVQNCRAAWAGLTQHLLPGIRGLRRRFRPQMEAQLILIAQGRAGRGVDFKSQSASNQRQDAECQVYHARRASKADATAIPKEQDSSHSLAGGYARALYELCTSYLLAIASEEHLGVPRRR